MKLEVGMYCRTKSTTFEPSRVGKIKNIDISSFKNIAVNLDSDNKSVYVEENNITKASFNLIDLIEVGDYVNGYKVETMLSFEGFEKLGFKNGLWLNRDNRHPIWLTNMKIEDIKSIVTHEQFKSVEYKVER